MNNINNKISNGTKKGILLFLLIVFFVFAGIKIVSAFSSPLGGLFGGRILTTKALEILTLESTGFICLMAGTSVQILPISPRDAPSSYFIPFLVTSKTRTTPMTGQLIIGKYTLPTLITCTLPGEPPVVKIVYLNTITLFGTSKF